MTEPTVVSENSIHLVDVPFDSQFIPSIKDENCEVWVGVRAVCSNLGLDPDGQLKRLKRQRWSVTVMMTVTAYDGKGYDTVMMNQKTFVMWLATIDTSRVNDVSRPIIERYQMKAADVLEDYFFPKNEQRQLPMTPHEEHMQQAQLMQSLKGLIHPDFLEAKARIVLAQEMHEAPEIDHDAHPLYVQDYLKENGLSSKRIRSKSMTFGKLLKREYIDRYHREPMKAPQMINDRMMDVYAYTERDRDLFDKVWRDMNLTLLIED